MTRIVLDPQMRAKLNGLREPVEFCDEEDHVLGHYSPVGDRALYVEVPFTDEELDRFEQEPGGRSLAEILADLEKKA
jgi:hypothetical protein